MSRLHASIEAGTIDGTDPTLKERVAALKATRDRALEALDYAKKSSALLIEIDPVAIDRFTRLMRQQLVSGDVAARKACRLSQQSLTYLPPCGRNDLDAMNGKTLKGARPKFRRLFVQDFYRSPSLVA
jgi:hypothetical protein